MTMTPDIAAPADAISVEEWGHPGKDDEPDAAFCGSVGNAEQCCPGSPDEGARTKR
jgi:hypothetical protein